MGGGRSIDPTEGRPSRQTVTAVCRRLEKEYHSPRLGNPVDPLDDLIYFLLSNRPAPVVAARVLEHARNEWGTWDEVIETRPQKLASVLAPAGLAAKRSKTLRSILKRLQRDFGEVTLDPLREASTEKAEAYLETLPGVSTKVAKCVLMYGFGRNVLPVDVHIHRLTSRLRWHSHRRADQSHRTLEAIIPPRLRYGFHTNGIAHSRLICRPKSPLCAACVILRFCPTGIRNIGGRGGPAEQEGTSAQSRKSGRRNRVQ